MIFPYKYFSKYFSIPVNILQDGKMKFFLVFRDWCHCA